MNRPTLLGSPLRVGRLLLRNRIVAAPMERNYGTRDGRVTERYLAYLRVRAAGGVALLFTEATYVRADGRGRVFQLGAHADHVVAGLRQLCDAVHAEGALLGVELNHAGRVAEPHVSGFQPVAPSPVPYAGRTPRELSTGETAQIVHAFAAAARRCVDAGADVVGLHAAHGYLIHQFLSPRTNHRTDRYADPVRFVNEVIVAVHDAVPDVPLVLRLSAMEGVPDGLDAEATLDAAARMRLDLIDVIDVSAGSYEAGEWIVQPGEFPRGVLAPYAAPYRRFGRLVAVAGRISTGAAAEAVLADGAADLVSIGRALHADPDWARTVLHGGAPRPCIACNQGCIDVVHTQRPIWCVVNPATSREAEPAPPPAAARRRVLVIGAGPAGLEASLTAAARGHEVTLLEAAPVAGGQFRLAAGLPSRPEFGRLTDWYRSELARAGVDVRLSTPADPAVVAAIAPEAVIVATGGIDALPAVPGIDLPRVAGVRAWLARNGSGHDGATVTVWGADRAGLAVADALADAGARVLLIGAQPEIAPEAGRREKILAVPRLTANPAVRILLGTTLERIEPHRLLVGRDGTREWIDVSGPLLVSQGTVPAPVLIGSGTWQRFTVGEAGFGASADAAIAQGAAAAQAIR
ncbi:FAD-dependent oxidoreductase [Actinoplanes sp. NPDC024001]|uniref:oxidoreductase n=1 Tax=Actinoplanes sp. NPDC024001 TaxID=3154598 RepID=UPI0034116E5D